jgi:hypothetical protein
VHVRIGDNCRECASVYASYRCNVASPYEVLRPAPKFKREYASNRGVTTVPIGRVEQSRAGATHTVKGRSDYSQARGGVSKSVERPAVRTERVKVVSTSRSSDTQIRTVNKTTTAKTRVSEPRKNADAKGGKTKVTARKNGAAKQADTASQKKKGAAKNVRQAR